MNSGLKYHQAKDECFTGHCEPCRKRYDRSVSICAFCWRGVSNKAFFKNDYHQTGKCKQRQAIPASIFERTVDKSMSYPRYFGPENNPEGKYLPTKHKFFRREKTSNARA